VIEHDAAQGTAEWLAARLGIPTASEFSRIVTPAKGAPSSQAHDYMCRLVGEWIAEEPEDAYTSDAMARGYMLQPQAIAWYQMAAGVDVRACGLCYLDERRLIGASPDGFAGDDVIVEVKCPLYTAHVRTLIAGDLPLQYRPQVQGQLWVTGAARCDYVSYHPRLPSVLVAVERSTSPRSRRTSGSSSRKC
jgi:putative phage-type endonuclease